MTYENIKTGVLRLFVLVNIILVIAGINHLGMNAPIFISVSTIILWSIYFLGLWIINGFIGKK